MKNFLVLTILLLSVSTASAQMMAPGYGPGGYGYNVTPYGWGGMMGGNNTITQSDDGHTAREEAEGKAIWEKLQSKEVSCEDLSDENFGALGEYFMGQMTGEQHETMNNMMIQMMGEEGEEQVHIAMGKRMSGCEPNAPMPQNMMDGGMMQMMMQMMMGGYGYAPGFGTPWAGYGYGFSTLSWVAVVILVAAVAYLLGKRRTSGS